MKKNQIKVGSYYRAKVNGKDVIVRVDAVAKKMGRIAGWNVTNLATTRRTMFGSAERFLEEVGEYSGNFLQDLYEAPTLPKMPEPASQPSLFDGEGDSRPDPIRLPESGPDAVAMSVPEAPPTSEGTTYPCCDNPDCPICHGSGTYDPDRDGVTEAAVEMGDEPIDLRVRKGPDGNPVPGTLAAKIAEAKAASEARKAADNAPHLIIEARAGTGKTTTLVEGLKFLKGLPVKITPSPQQKAVWDALALGPKPERVAFVAYNKSIADELEARVPPGCDAMTMHRLGLKAIRRAFPNLRPGLDATNEYRVRDIIEELTGTDIRELMRHKFDLVKAVEGIVDLCKSNLVGYAFDENGPSKLSGGSINWEEELDRLVDYYDIDLGEARRSEIYDLVPRVLERCKDVARDGQVDFNDMVWLPVVLDLPIEKYDLLLVDEAQDLNRCRQELAKMAGRRLVLCGDPKQAIYGFAGADAKAMERMRQELNGGALADYAGVNCRDGRGCMVLPLTVTRRCGKAIVREAQKYVPDFEAHESNPEGNISSACYSDKTDECPGGEDRVTYSDLVREGDFLLCRVNAPLVSQCFRFIKAGKRANIQGRDVGQGLISTVKKLSKKDDFFPVVDLIGRIDDWFHEETRKENAKRNPSESRLIALQDRRDCLNCFCDDTKTAGDVIKKIESLFGDKECPKCGKKYGQDRKVCQNPSCYKARLEKPTGIRLSSIHKAKGLEAPRVFFLRPKGGECPHPMAKAPWEREQELNLCYVAVTRAIEELVYVS